MSTSQEWYEVGSKKKKIDILTKKTLHELNTNVDLSDIYSRINEFNNLENRYDSNQPYADPYGNQTFFNIKDKPIPSESSRLIQESDTIYIGMAKAAKAGMKEIGEKAKPLDDYSPDRFLNLLIGIIQLLAARIERKSWSNKRDGIFFNDPSYITTIDR